MSRGNFKPPVTYNAATCRTNSVYYSGVLRYDISSMTSAQSKPADRSTMAEAPVILCPQCGYDLHGLLATRCPECGLDVVAVKAIGSLIPFTYRQGMGFWRAYWKTVRWVIFRRKQFAQSASRPVDDRDARLFQHVTLLLASIPAAIAAMALAATSGLGILPESMSSAPRPIESLDVMWYPVMALCVWVFFFVLTWMPRYGFLSRCRSPELRHRAISLSYFAAAPFAYTFIPVMLALLSILIQSAEWHDTGFGQTLFSLSIGLMGLTLFAQFVAWIIGVADFMEASTKLTRRARMCRVLIIEFTAPASAILVAFILTPMIYALIAILIDSLR